VVPSSCDIDLTLISANRRSDASRHPPLTLSVTRALCLVALALGGHVLVTSGQALADDALLPRLRDVFPAASEFSPKADNPPHYKAYVSELGTGRRVPAGFVFWTTDLEPLERGYSGPIRILVGMDTRATLTGIAVVAHREPYGHFSIDLPAYAAQFRGKSIRDPFRLGDDIHAVSRATVTMSSATRAVKNGARRIARDLLAPVPLAVRPVWSARWEAGADDQTWR
jgi:transcriptional regulator of nitric oxide reductase